jgi:predicted DNA-binding transcriptional regulator YafY
MDRPKRLYWIDAEIHAGRYPNPALLAERFGIFIRTAYSDRDALREDLHAPLVFDRAHGGWTYIDRCEQRQAIRQFYLGRVRNWKLLHGEGQYSVSPSFNAQDYLAQGFGATHGDNPVTVRLRFSPLQARWIRERTYHPSPTTIEHVDGSLELTVEVAGTQEILRWILDYGPEVEVLEPAALRCQVTESAKKLPEIYRKTRD